MKTIYLPAGTEHVQYSDLARLIAVALFPSKDGATDSELMAQGVARLNLETELAQAVKSGALPVKDPSTYGPHPWPVGNLLMDALVTVDDLRLFLNGRPVSVELEPAAHDSQAEAPAGPEQPANSRKWTSEKLAELREYRERHTMPETAGRFGISEQRIRQLLPSRKPKATLFSGLIHRKK